MDLRPYQLDAIENARVHIRNGAKRVLIIIPTGGGKTVVASAIIDSAVAKGARVLFLAHRRELIQQTSDKLQKFGVPHGVIQAGYPMALHRPVQVASVQTLARRPGKLTQVDLVFIDEAHHVTTGNTYSTLLGWYPNAKAIGLTATPWRLDGRGLGDVFEAHVLGRTPRELRDEGFLVPVGGWEYEGIDTSNARVERGDFVIGDLHESATSKRVIGDVVSEWQLHAGNARTVLFAIDVEHSRLMVEAFRAAGVAAEHIDGEMDTTERDAIVARLRSGETRVVSNCNVLTEGFDCPELECCVLARPTLSTALYLQMVGRVLRPAPGKAVARIHDHAGCLAAHGHPYADRDYSPTVTARAPRKKAEGSIPPAKRCAACKSVISRWPCDACGYSPNPQELQVQYEHEEAAARREIQNDGVAPARKDTPDDRAKRWQRVYAHDDRRKREFFDRMVAKHGPKKGPRIYWWFSGETEKAPREWVEEVRAQL